MFLHPYLVAWHGLPLGLKFWKVERLWLKYFIKFDQVIKRFKSNFVGKKLFYFKVFSEGIGFLNFKKEI